MNNNLKETLKNALILCVITLIAGFLLGGIYEITKEPRAKQEEKSKKAAYQTVMQKANSFVELEGYDKDVKSLLNQNGITEKNVLVDSIIEAYDKEKKLLGYIVSVTSKEGYGGNISFSVGIDLDETVKGVSILSINETAGLGMNAKEDSFLDQYKQEGEGFFVVNKSESEEGINIDGLSGATITSKAMTKGVNAAKLAAEAVIQKNDHKKIEEGGGDDENK